jgi:hypothetical protein
MKSSVIVTKSSVSINSGIDKNGVKKVANRIKAGKLPASLMPDFGIFVFNQVGIKPIAIEVNNPSITINEVEAYISFTVGGRLATVITDEEIAVRYAFNRFSALVAVSPKELYQTSRTKEWVMPFRIVRLD